MAEAFIIAQMTISDHAAFADYLPKAGATVLQYGGEFVIGGSGPREVIEGNPEMPMIAVVKFPTYDDALRWYHSPEYAPLIDARLKAASGTITLLEGFG